MPELPACLQSKIAASLLDHDQIALLNELCSRDQTHLFDGWDVSGRNDERKLAFLDQLIHVHRSYPGGIGGYLGKTRRLLDEAPEHDSPDEDTRLDNPVVVDLTRLDAAYHEMEQRGLAQAGALAFVLVAGGLGERLGHSGIKVGIPIEITANTTYLQHYCSMIKALENHARCRTGDEHLAIPFFIMTSDGTSAQTVALLEENRYFGLDPDQVRVCEQHLVPSISDREAHLVLETPYSLQLKPNGHGDIHALLHEQGFAEAVRSMGKTHLVFIQDTNAQVVDLVLPALGASLAEDFDFNFVCVPRVPAEPLGAVVRLRKPREDRTIAVEYNLLDAFLQKLEGTGDQADRTGYSSYPGSINLLVVKLDSYLDVLRETGGMLAEFINPKYEDDSRTNFSRPTRIETLMQDLACAYGPDARIGATLFERDRALAAVKNKLETAIRLAAAKQPSYSAAAAESGFYANARVKLAAAGVVLAPAEETDYHGIPFQRGARVVLSPAFSLTLSDAGHKLKDVSLGRDTSLVIDGESIFLDMVRLEGDSSLVIRACPGATVTVRGLTLTETGYRFRELDKKELDDPEIPAILKMRGYRRETAKPLVITIDEPGRYLVGPDGLCRIIAT